MMRRALLAITILLATAPAAQATLTVSADTGRDRGHILLRVFASSDLRDVRVGEIVGRAYREIAPVTLEPFGTFEGFGELSSATLPKIARWRCDRLRRQFVAYATDPAGALVKADFDIRTPSCENRLRLVAPTRTRGDEIAVTVRDTFGLGDVEGRLCGRLEDRRPRCRTVRVPAGRTRLRTTVGAPRDGRWRLGLRTARQRLTAFVAVGVRPRPADLERLPTVLATGDSLMQGLDAVLDDRLGGRAQVERDVQIGTGLTKPFVTDWGTLPARQTRRLSPDAVLLFLGSNDGLAIGDTPCCGTAWIAAYTRLVRRTMRAYARGGRTRVYWLTIPTARQVKRRPVDAAVNAAIARAAKKVRGARAVDTVGLLTPGGAYRASMPYRGERLRVRQSDGLHLTTDGAGVVADLLLGALERDGVL